MRQSDFETAHLAQSNAQHGPAERRRSLTWLSVRRSAWASVGVLGTGALLSLTGCPASLENPERFDVAPVSAGGPGMQPGLNVDTTCLVAAFSASCAMNTICHKAGATAAAGLDLESPGVNARLINIKAPHKDANPATGCVPNNLVDTANPAASWLSGKLDTDGKTCGSKMPIGMITAEQTACIKKYVQDVAASASSAGMGPVGAAPAATGGTGGT